MADYENIGELGGFADDIDDVTEECTSDDEKERTFNAFNFCLAEDYYGAMVREDFYSLGVMSNHLIETICYWLNYDGTINKNMIDEIKKIPTGDIITNKNRKFYEAVIDAENGNIASILIYNGNYDSRLFVTSLLYDSENTILMQLNNICSSKEELEKKLLDIFLEIDKYFKTLKTLNERIEVLKIVKTQIEKFKYPKEYSTLDLKLEKYDWYKTLKLLNNSN